VPLARPVIGSLAGALAPTRVKAPLNRPVNEAAGSCKRKLRLRFYLHTALRGVL
jgi:hypothetical protein